MKEKIQRQLQNQNKNRKFTEQLKNRKKTNKWK